VLKLLSLYELTLNGEGAGPESRHLLREAGSKDGTCICVEAAAAATTLVWTWEAGAWA
jgi:hypothetical protein